jgi:hypothetical protein
MKTFLARARDVAYNVGQFYVEMLAALFASGFVGAWLANFDHRLGPVIGVLILLLMLGIFLRMGLRYREMMGEAGGRNVGLVFVLLVSLSIPPGGLMAVAAPNFRRHATKARQSEAKIALAAVYGAEKSYFQEYGYYASSFNSIGYTPEGQRRFYALGFSPACKGNAKYGEGFINLQNSPFGEKRAAEIEKYFREKTTCKDPQLGFEVYAVGITYDGGPLDVWKIDESKRLENVEEGI